MQSSLQGMAIHGVLIHLVSHLERCLKLKSLKSPERQKLVKRQVVLQRSNQHGGPIKTSLASIVTHMGLLQEPNQEAEVKQQLELWPIESL